MEPIFSREGQVVAWFKDDVVYDEIGRPRAFVRERNLYAFDAFYLGRCENGYFREPHGDAVAWMRGAHSGPTTPATRVIPKAPTPWAITVKPDVRVAPKAVPPSVLWSETEWAAFLQIPLEAE